MGTLKGEETAAVEEHCTRRFLEAEKFITALRGALKRYDRLARDLR